MLPDASRCGCSAWCGCTCFSPKSASKHLEMSDAPSSNRRTFETWTIELQYLSSLTFCNFFVWQSCNKETIRWNCIWPNNLLRTSWQTWLPDNFPTNFVCKLSKLILAQFEYDQITPVEKNLKLSIIRFFSLVRRSIEILVLDKFQVWLDPFQTNILSCFYRIALDKVKNVFEHLNSFATRHFVTWRIVAVTKSTVLQNVAFCKIHQMSLVTKGRYAELYGSTRAKLKFFLLAQSVNHF